MDEIVGQSILRDVGFVFDPHPDSQNQRAFLSLALVLLLLYVAILLAAHSPSSVSLLSNLTQHLSANLQTGASVGASR
jgi:hypothetical protein